MTRRSISVLGFALVLCVTVLAACSGAGKDPAASSVEAYLQAIVTGNANQLSSLSCKDWASHASVEMDSFIGVKATLDNLSCQKTGGDSASASVTCTGKIQATYNNEKQEFDLSGQTYHVVQEGGEWLVCGYK